MQQFCGIPDDAELFRALVVALPSALFVAGMLRLLLAHWRHGPGTLRRVVARVWIACVGFAVYFVTTRGVGGPCIFTRGPRHSVESSYRPWEMHETLWLGLGIGLLVGLVWSAVEELRWTRGDR